MSSRCKGEQRVERLAADDGSIVVVALILLKASLDDEAGLIATLGARAFLAIYPLDRKLACAGRELDEIVQHVEFVEGVELGFLRGLPVRAVRGSHRGVVTVWSAVGDGGSVGGDLGELEMICRRTQVVETCIPRLRVQSMGSGSRSGRS